MVTEIGSDKYFLTLVVAATESNRGIGKNGTIPWKLPMDMKFFRLIDLIALQIIT
jgi:dihydrofolate reductase